MPGLEVAAMGVEKGTEWVKMCLERYENRSFVKQSGAFDTTVLPIVVENVLRKKSFALPTVRDLSSAKLAEKTDIPVFPCEYFSPKSYKTGRILTTKNTCCIHHFAGSWLVTPKYVLFESKFWNLFGLKNLNLLGKLYWKICVPAKKIISKRMDK